MENILVLDCDILQPGMMSILTGNVEMYSLRLK